MARKVPAWEVACTLVQLAFCLALMAVCGSWVFKLIMVTTSPDFRFYDVLRPKKDPVSRIKNWDHFTVSWPAMREQPPQSIAQDEDSSGNRNDNYPNYKSLQQLLRDWVPNEPDPPLRFVESLQHFNYSDPKEREAALRYRDAELPFKLYDVPEVAEVVSKWSDDNYLKDAFLHNSGHTHVEVSASNRFMYWSLEGITKPDGWSSPTEKINSYPFKTWLYESRVADRDHLNTDDTHKYFLASTPTGDDGKSFISRDLPFFATDEPNFFIPNVHANKGIQCRFGMRGIISEAHYDSGRNMNAQIRGYKRTILLPPSTCSNLSIITDPKHPSYRHSTIDWTDQWQQEMLGFNTIPAVETIMQPGEVLYIPSYWLHYIINLKYNIQCNSRSGLPANDEGQAEIEECLGFKLNTNNNNIGDGGDTSSNKKHTQPNTQQLKNEEFVEDDEEEDQREVNLKQTRDHLKRAETNLNQERDEQVYEQEVVASGSSV